MDCSTRPTKRQRLATCPVTPESESDGDYAAVTTTKRRITTTSSSVVTRALNVLQTEAEALSHISALYATSPTAQASLQATISALLEAQHHGGKLVTCGVGKSSYIAMKLTATCKSLGIASSFMHACEAAHGDLGDLRPDRKDVLLFVSFSGKTPELLNLLPHVPEGMTVVALTAHVEREECAMLRGRDGEKGILLPAPIPVKEEVSFGVSAPTTSTTVALAVADMVALAMAEEVHREEKRGVFLRNHPGGAIGLTQQQGTEKAVAVKVEKGVKRKVEVAVMELPSPSISAESED